ncbi:MAG TPA: type IX secretion system membrane protein PorP/SprF, partial [Bacteroidia bacterium]|nr:type IX secretion system membrane protein PorP/SprF [Bacteroidia bacterium]
MKKSIFSALLVSTGLFAYGQQDAQFTQFMFTKLNTNPAFAGTDHAYNAGLTYRDQWVNLPGNPTTLVFNGDAYI